MWFGCRLSVAVVSQAYPGNAEICPGFLPPQAALRIILSNEGDQLAYESYKILRWRSMHRQIDSRVRGRRVEKWELIRLALF